MAYLLSREKFVYYPTNKFEHEFYHLMCRHLPDVLMSKGLDPIATEQFLTLLTIVYENQCDAKKLIAKIRQNLHARVDKQTIDSCEAVIDGCAKCLTTPPQTQQDLDEIADRFANMDENWVRMINQYYLLSDIDPGTSLNVIVANYLEPRQQGALNIKQSNMTKSASTDVIKLFDWAVDDMVFVHNAMYLNATASYACFKYQVCVRNDVFDKLLLRQFIMAYKATSKHPSSSTSAVIYVHPDCNYAFLEKMSETRIKDDANEISVDESEKMTTVKMLQSRHVSYNYKREGVKDVYAVVSENALSDIFRNVQCQFSVVATAFFNDRSFFYIHFYVRNFLESKLYTILHKWLKIPLMWSDPKSVWATRPQAQLIYTSNTKLLHGHEDLYLYNHLAMLFVQNYNKIIPVPDDIHEETFCLVTFIRLLKTYKSYEITKKFDVFHISAKISGPLVNVISESGIKSMADASVTDREFETTNASGLATILNTPIFSGIQAEHSALEIE